MMGQGPPRPGLGAVELAPSQDSAWADAVLAASVFHFGQITIPEVKDVLAAAGFPVRRRYTPREPAR